MKSKVQRVINYFFREQDKLNQNNLILLLCVYFIRICSFLYRLFYEIPDFI